MKILTNNRAIPVHTYLNLPLKEKDKYRYLPPDRHTSHLFFLFKRKWFCIHSFRTDIVPPYLSRKGYVAFYANTPWTGIAVKINYANMTVTPAEILPYDINPFA